MCSLTLFLFAFVSSLLIETTKIKKILIFFSVCLDDGRVVLGGFFG